MFVMLLGQYWVNSNFISRAEFRQEKEGALKQYNADQSTLRAELKEIGVSVNSINESLALFRFNAERIVEQGAQIRNNENKINNHEARIQVLESRRPNTPKQEPK